MKLKDGMIADRAGDDYVAVATGEASKSFNGLIKNNKTADFIFRQLMTDKTEDQLVEALLDKYDVSEENARKDVRKIIEKLMAAGILDE